MEKRNLLEKLAQAAGLETEPLPGLPLIELSGNRRVLIENHQGVSCYASERICVRVRGGAIEICGQGMALSCISRERLILTGRIEAVHLLWGA